MGSFLAGTRLLGAPPSDQMKSLSTWVSYTGGKIAILSNLAAYFFEPSKNASKDPLNPSCFHVLPVFAGVVSKKDGDQG